MTVAGGEAAAKADVSSVHTRHLPVARLPMHCMTIGRALLASAPEPLVDGVLTALTPHTEFTETDPAVVRAQLVRIRRTRVAESWQ